MKLVLEFDDNSEIIHSKKDTLILYDGKKWYTTTRLDVFCEYEDKIAKLNAAYEKLVEENKQFKSTVSAQISEMADLIQSLYSGKGE